MNTARGSAFPEISLDDLAIDLFSSNQETSSNDEAKREGRSVRRWASDTASSARRGRSVSRQKQNPKGITGNCGDNSSRRRRSLSVARNRVADSESDRDLSLRYERHGNLKDLVGGRNQMSSTVLPGTPNGRRLERSRSLKDLSLSNDGYSSQSSALTDEETRNAHQDNFGTEKTIHTVYAQKKSEHPPDDGSSRLYEAMRKEVRHAVEELRTEFQQVVGRTDTTREEGEEVHQSLSVVKQKYAAKLKQSEKHKQDLLSEIIIEEQRGRDLSKLVKEIVTDSKKAVSSQRPARTRKRSNDRTRMSSKLVEEAEKYFVDFISNVEDTDISSFDGERSDASSSLGFTSKVRGGTNYVEAESFQSLAVPMGTDGVLLPWLQWETSNDACLSSKSMAQTPATPKALKFDAEEEMNFVKDSNCHSVGSRARSSCDHLKIHQITKEKDAEILSGVCKKSWFDMDLYLELQRKEDSLFEIYKERHRINCGGLLLCAGVL